MAVLDLIPKKKKKAPKGASTPPVKVPLFRPEPLPSNHPVPPRLAKKLVALGGTYRSIHLREWFIRILTAAVILVTVQMLLDWLFILNVFERFLLLAADIAGLVYVIRRFVLPILLHPPKMEACALMVEKHWPRLRGRVIATVQLARPSFTRDSPELVETLQQDTDAKTAMMNFGEVVSTVSFKRRIKLATAVSLVWLSLMVLLAPGSIALLERVFLIPAKVPRKTEIICLSGDKVIPAGDSVLLEAQARGIIPSHGMVTMTDEVTGRIQEVTLDPEDGQPDRFALKIDRLEQSMSYAIQLGDSTTDTYTIKTVPRPNVTTVDCQQIYPAYTGLDPIKRTVGNLALLAGSKLKLHTITNSKIVKAGLKLVPSGQVLPLTIAGTDGNDLSGEIDIPATGLTGFSIELTNQAGITSGDETQYRIDIIPDRAPGIELTFPEQLQELYTLKAKPTIAFVASDDYGLAKVTLCYRIIQDQDSSNADSTNDSNSDSNTPGPPPQRIEMDLGSDKPLNMKNRYTWDLSAIKPPITEEQTIEYWMEAEDANNVTGPGIGDSEHHTIKVASEAEKKADVMNRLMDSLSTLGDISQNQEKINQDLGDAIQGKQTPAPVPNP